VKDKILSDITSAIFKKQSITRKMAHILLKGLPESGKTSLLNRLLKKPFCEQYSSTGMCERTVTVEVGPSSTHTSCYTSDEKTWAVTDFDESMVSQLDGCKQFALSSREDENPAILHPGGGPSEPVSDLECHVKEVLNKHNITNIVDLQTKCSLYIRDTGGQVEFQESLSLLIFGPSVFIFVLKTNIDLHAKYTIQYRLATGEVSNRYTSSISTMDALIQFLTSVSAIQTTEEGVFEVDGTSVCHKPIVFIVGTHTDLLGSEAQPVLDSINQELHEMISKWKFSHIISYADGLLNRVMYEVNNIKGDDTQFQKLRSGINRYISCKSEFSVKYPVSYLLFCLELQNIEEAVLSMDRCKKLAAKFNIEEREIGSLLHFLHFRVGIIQHYNVKGISDVIIKEPQVLLDKVTELILNTFLLNPTLPKAQQKSFCEKGILEFSAFGDVLNENDQITSEQFLLFLLHLHVAVRFTDKMGIRKYFIPSVLNHVPKSPLGAVDTNIVPLAITFQLGHCPKGLFGMMIAYLLDPEDSQELTFDLSEEHIYQDQVSLLVSSSDDIDKICLRNHLSYLEVGVVLENYSTSAIPSELCAPRGNSPSFTCCKIRKTLEDCIQFSLKKLHYDYKKIGTCFSLRCSYDNCSQLHEVKMSEKCCYMRCSNNNPSKVRLGGSAKLWFNEGKVAIRILKKMIIMSFTFTGASTASVSSLSNASTSTASTSTAVASKCL